MKDPNYRDIAIKIHLVDKFVTSKRFPSVKLNTFYQFYIANVLHKILKILHYFYRLFSRNLDF